MNFRDTDVVARITREQGPVMGAKAQEMLAYERDHCSEGLRWVVDDFAKAAEAGPEASEGTVDK